MQNAKQNKYATSNLTCKTPKVNTLYPILKPYIVPNIEIKQERKRTHQTTPNMMACMCIY
jgi:hypothetical protein